MKNFKLNEPVLRQLAEQAKLTQSLEDVEGVLTLNYLASRLLLAYQMNETYKGIDNSDAIDNLKKDIVELIKNLEL